jgi:membrane-bound lytic murein transglycosylase B
MSDKSAFTESEWHAITEAPLLVTAAIFFVGEHGPISMLKEASASARSISKPGERGVANELIGQIVAEANTKETRAELKEHRGPTPQAAVESALHELEPVATALKKLPPDEGAQVAAWFVDIAKAVAASAKSVNAEEEATIEKIAALFGVSTG